MFPTIVNNPLTSLKANTPPELTTATITQYYSQIDTTWDLGTQQATLQAEPYSRVYSLLTFPYTETRLTKVDLTTYDPDYGATFYYLVSSYFQESSYNSNIYSTANNPFSQWTQIDSCYRQEITYTHTQVNQLIWNRPIITEGSTSEEGIITAPIYETLATGYSLSINVGTALGTIITSVSPIQVKLKSSSSDAGTIVDPSFILLTEPILDITLLDITSTSHIQIIVTFYGLYKWRNFLPISSADPQTLLHPIQTSLEDKLKPPGLSSLPDNFWNSDLGNQVVTDFSTRGNSPQWI